MRNKTGRQTPFRWMLRNYLFLLVAALLISFVVFPMQGMMRVLSLREMLEMQEEPLGMEARMYQTRELTMGFVYSPLNLELLCLVFGALGFGAAMVLFRHLFSRNQGMMYAGLPVTRERDFLLRTGVFAVCVLLPVAFCLALHPVIVRANGLEEYLKLDLYAGRGGAVLLITLYGYALGALCASLFGTLWSALLGGLLIAGSLEITALAWLYIARWYLNTLFWDWEARKLAVFSPVWTMYKAFYQPGAYSVLPGVIATGGLMILALLARKRVRPENAGLTLNQKKLEPVLLTWAAVLGGTAGGIVLTMYLSHEVMLYLGMALGTGIAWLLARMLLDQRVRPSGKGWKTLAGALAVVVLAALGLRMDVSGFQRYAPRAEDLRAVRMDPGMSGGSSVMEFTDPESLTACLAWAAQAREEMQKAREKEAFDPGAYGEVTVTFVDRGGHASLRQYRYPRRVEALLPSLRVMAGEWNRRKSEELSDLPKASAYGSLQTFGLYEAEVSELFGFTPDVRGRRDPEILRETLRKDLLARTMEKEQLPALAYVAFQGEKPAAGLFEDTYGYESYEIKVGDERTLKALLGADAEKWEDFAMGGFIRSEEIAAFLCEYSEAEDGERKLDGYRRIEGEEEMREWMTRVTCCSERLFRAPVDSGKQLVVYSLPRMRDQIEYNDEIDYDLEDPQVIAHLPELDGVWGTTFEIMAGDF